MASTSDPTPLLTPGRVLLVIAALVCTVAMMPCLGILNWVALPVAALPAGMGGLAVYRLRRADPELRLQPAPFLGLLLGGAVLMLASALRLVLGAGVL
ncbi:MAG: hypothetical protein ABIO70_17505 [Pseudomonadota bacterium]